MLVTDARGVGLTRAFVSAYLIKYRGTVCVEQLVHKR